MVKKGSQNGSYLGPLFDPLWTEIPRFLRVLDVNPLCTLPYRGPKWDPKMVILGHPRDPLFQGVAGFDLAEFGICSQGWSKRGPKMTPKPAPGTHSGTPSGRVHKGFTSKTLRNRGISCQRGSKRGPKYDPFWDPFLTTPGQKYPDF